MVKCNSSQESKCKYTNIGLVDHLEIIIPKSEFSPRTFYGDIVLLLDYATLRPVPGYGKYYAALFSSAFVYDAATRRGAKTANYMYIGSQ